MWKMRMHDYYRSLGPAEVPGGLLKAVLKRGCWSGTSVVGCLGRGGRVVKRMGNEKEEVKKKKGKTEESLER